MINRQSINSIKIMKLLIKIRLFFSIIAMTELEKIKVKNSKLIKGRIIEIV